MTMPERGMRPAELPKKGVFEKLKGLPKEQLLELGAAALFALTSAMGSTDARADEIKMEPENVKGGKSAFQKDSTLPPEMKKALAQLELYLKNNPTPVISGSKIETAQNKAK